MSKLKFLALLFLALLLTGSFVSAKEGQQAKLPTITLTAGTESIKAEVAATDPTRMTGMMFREKMGANEGMLFVFPQVAYHAMWMKNTLLPLSVAFMDEAGVILSIHEMQPQTEDTHQAAGPARYGLEMNAAWFKQHGVKAGDKIKGLDKAPKPQ